jgi:hypothetical protein
MTTLTSDIYKEGSRRTAPQTLRLAAAYEAVFVKRRPMQEDVDLVMADLAEFSGYFTTAPTSTNSNDLWDLNGKRSVFARILSLIAIPRVQLEELRKAALDEMHISNTEGQR